MTDQPPMPGNPELLACPWCAAKAKAYIAFPQSDTPWHIDVDHGDDCPLRGLDSHCYATREDAERAWNTRATPALPEEREKSRPITSRELMERAGMDPDAPFEVGPFPAEMRQATPAPIQTVKQQAQELLDCEREKDRTGGMRPALTEAAALRAVEKALSAPIASLPDEEAVEHLRKLLMALAGRPDITRLFGFHEKKIYEDARQVANAALASIPSPDGLREALDEVYGRAELGRETVRELQTAMHAHYETIREHLGKERGPGFARRVNSMLLRASGQFFQIKERVAALRASLNG